ncbi:MAG: c-type cytochrome [Opitutaceae bacterium]
MSEDKHSSGPHPNNKESLEQAAMQDGQMQDVHAQLMREKEEPSEGFSPVPIFLLFIFAGLCFWGGVYLIEHGGGFRWDAYSPDFDPNADAPKPPELTLFERGEKVFRKQCAICHQPTGAGVPGVYPPLDSSEWVTDHPEMLARILINGLTGQIEVAGKSFNGTMPAFGPGGLSKLSNQDLAGVMTYIRQAWSNEASDMTVKMTEDYVAAYGSRSTPWTAPELKEGLGPIPEPEPEVVEEVPAEEAPAEDAHAEEAAH